MNDYARRLEHDLKLMTAGREQDRNELAICIDALLSISSERARPKLSRKQMIETARQALVNIGALPPKDT